LELIGGGPAKGCLYASSSHLDGLPGWLRLGQRRRGARAARRRAPVQPTSGNAPSHQRRMQRSAARRARRTWRGRAARAGARGAAAQPGRADRQVLSAARPASSHCVGPVESARRAGGQCAGREAGPRACGARGGRQGAARRGRQGAARRRAPLAVGAATRRPPVPAAAAAGQVCCRRRLSLWPLCRRTAVRKG